MLHVTLILRKAQGNHYHSSKQRDVFLIGEDVNSIIHDGDMHCY